MHISKTSVCSSVDQLRSNASSLVIYGGAINPFVSVGSPPEKIWKSDLAGWLPNIHGPRYSWRNPWWVSSNTFSSAERFFLLKAFGFFIWSEFRASKAETWTSKTEHENLCKLIVSHIKRSIWTSFEVKDTKFMKKSFFTLPSSSSLEQLL